MSASYETFEHFLKANNFQKRIDELAEKYQNKKIILYGAGTAFDIIKKNFDLSNLNIVGIADKKFVKKHKGYETFESLTFLNEKPDIVLISMLETNKAEDFFKEELMPEFGEFNYESLIKDIPNNEIKLLDINDSINKEKFCINYKNVTYNTDGLITQANCDFIKDTLFKESYNLGKNTGSWKSDPIWRCYIVCCAAMHGLNYEGDYVECGVNKGGLSRAVMHYIDFKQQKNRKFWLFDTFNGIDIECCNEKEKNHAEKLNNTLYTECYEDVQKTFKDFENVKIIKGNVMETLEQFTGNKVVFLSIDMNCLAPEIKAINFFWDKIVSGGIVVLDDYGWPSHEEQKLAMDDFTKKVGTQIISLPTGQGLIIKK